MMCRSKARFAATAVAILAAFAAPNRIAAAGTYEDLVGLFKEWREFQKPKMVDGVPDYSAAAMKAQREGLEPFRARLAAIDPQSWPLPRRADYEIVRAEMNGLEFEHRVIRPWSRDPGFYVAVAGSEPDVPSREGPEIYGVLNLWPLKFPLSGKDLAEVRQKIRAIPRMLDQARTNLVEEARDLWTIGIRAKKQEKRVLDRLAARMAEFHPDLVPDVERAGKAVDEFGAWLERKWETMKAVPCGIGIEEYNWSMKNVHLVPYTWEDQLRILQGELDRALASLELERHRNRKLPEQDPAASQEDLNRRYAESVDTFMKFLKDDVFTVPDYMVYEQRGWLAPNPKSWDFFNQIDYRDPLPMRCHMFHWLEKQRMVREPHPNPIRREPLLYNIWDSRSEGLATGLEEMMMQAGLLDGRPRSRELVYILIAVRAIRGIADLKLQSNEFDLDAAVRYAVAATPYGWLPADRQTIWTDVGIYLRQPGYGTTYIIGKAQIYQLMAERFRRKGNEPSLKPFMDEFFASGLIPVSLIQWEMLGSYPMR